MADSGVETGNESNDNCPIHNSHSRSSSTDEEEEELLDIPEPDIPPPPPTSPEIQLDDLHNSNTFINHNTHDDGLNLPRGSSSSGSGVFHDDSIMEDDFEDNYYGMNDNFGSIFSLPPPPAPPVTPNTCKALIKFEFPEEKPKLFYNLPFFISTIQSEEEKKGLLPTVSSCQSLIPYYEQHDLHHKDRCYSRKYFKNRLNDWNELRKQQCEARLLTAANVGNVQMLMRILSKNVNPNASDELGRTALHVAACKGYGDIVGLLLNAGANPNQKDSVGNTPLHLAACTSHFQVVTFLLRAGTDVSTLDKNGRNPLQLAQSKLKLIATKSEDSLKTKMEIQQIIEMMSEYLQKKGHDEDAELLNELATRLTLSTEDKVDDDVKMILANLSSLSLNSNIKQGMGIEGCKKLILENELSASGIGKS